MPPIIISEKDIILRSDNSEITTSDLEQIKNENPVAEYFEEPQFNLKVLSLLSFENSSDKYKRIPLREFYSTHNEDENFFAFRAKALFEWRKNTKFCSACGTKLKPHPVQTAFVCPDCGKIFFPKIEPCIIVLISKDEKILLARHVNRNQDIYACIAGFMEAGESAEEAVRREIREEVGITVKNIVYRGSQSWPFPDQLMLGFTADYESGDLKLQKEEIADAQWFDRNNCPASPKPGSIAYNLIHRNWK